jgi:hypothetical protein
MFCGLTKNEAAGSKEMAKNVDETKTKVSYKNVLPFIEEMQAPVAKLEEIVGRMPECTRKKYLITSIEGLKKKTAISIKELSEEQVAQYIGRHPEILAKYARSDEGAKEVSADAMTPEDTDAMKAENEPKKHKKNRL